MGNYQLKKFNYFVFDNIKYGAGTKIKTTERALINFPTLRKHNVVIFQYKLETDDRLWCLVEGLCMIAIPYNKYYIEHIIEPVYYKEKPTLESALENYSSGKKRPDVFHQWIWYIFIMCFLVICKNGWIAMIITTCVFGKWLIDQYKD